MKTKTFSIYLASAAAWAILAMTAIPALADDPHGWIGGALGLSIPNADSTTSRGIYGISGGAKLGSEWGIGAYFLTSSKDESTSTGTIAFNYELYGVEFAYHFEGEAVGAYIGGRVGTSKVKSGSGTTLVSTSPSHYGLVGGYNHFLTNQFSLGGEINYLSVPSSSASVSGSPVTINSFSIMNFLFTGKLWF